jgi:hypothetical protein
VVFLHDRDGAGPVLVVAVMVQLLDRVPLSDALGGLAPEERSRLSVSQVQALQSASAAVSGDDPYNGPYVPLRGARR